MENRPPVFNSLGFAHLASGDHASEHALPALKLVVPLDAPVRTRCADGREIVESRAMLVAPGQAQAMGSDGHSFALFYTLDTFRAAVPSGVQLLDSRTSRWLREAFGAWRDVLGSAEPDAAIMAEIAERLSLFREVSVDPRVERALTTLQAQDGLDLAGLAAQVELSGSRLSHLVRNQTGTTLRHWSLWSRALRGIGRLVAGQSITDAALDAGFSDHAHFTRTLRRFFGQPPSYITALLA